MSQQVHNLATKGILGGLPGTKGFIILDVQQGAVQGGGFIPGLPGAGSAPEKSQKWIKVKFEYDGAVREQVLYIDKDVKVTAENIELSIDNVEPTIELVGFEQEVNVLEPIVTISFKDI